jgi:two-component system cell cycle response regulator CpdR
MPTTHSHGSTGAPQAAVLICDDDPAVRHLMARTLGKAGFQVAVASHPAHALELCSAIGAALRVLVTDLRMPEMNGIELARAVRGMVPDVAVVLVSGFPEEFADRVGTIGGAMLLAKPFHPAELAGLVAASLRGENVRA